MQIFVDAYAYPVVRNEKQSALGYQTEKGCLLLEGVRPCTRYQEIEVDCLAQNFQKQHRKFM